jgi:3-dehydroquinate synthase class II
MEKSIWVRADGPEDYEERKKLVSSALEEGMVHIVRGRRTSPPRLGRFEASR